MKQKIKTICILMTLFFAMVVFVPDVLADQYTIEQNDVSCELRPIDRPGDCIAQSFVPTETFIIDEFEAYVYLFPGSDSTILYGGVSLTKSDNTNDWLGTYKYDETYIDEDCDGWICFAFIEDLTLQSGTTYYIIVKNAGNIRIDSCCHGGINNPYPGGSPYKYDSYDDSWEPLDNANSDFGFKIRGHNDSPPTTPSISGPSNGNVNVEYTFTASSTDPQGYSIRYRWNFDGNWGSYSSSNTAKYTWTNPGSKTVMAQAKNAAGLESEIGSHTITIQDDSPDPTYDLTVTASPAEGGSVFYVISGGKSGTVESSETITDILAGTAVSLDYCEEDGWSFDKWTGNVPSDHENDLVLDITMDADKSITANFIDTTQEYTLTVKINPPGSGSVSLSPTGGTYPSSTTVTLDPSATSGYSFDYWSGDLSGSSDPASIFMNGNKVVTANFLEDSNNPTYDFSFIHVTDLHLGPITIPGIPPEIKICGTEVWTYYVLPKILECNPKFVVFTGDLVDAGQFPLDATPTPLNWYLNFISTSLNGERGNWKLKGSYQSIPIYFCPGNHDNYLVTGVPDMNPITSLLNYKLYIDDSDYSESFTITGTSGKTYSVRLVSLNSGIDVGLPSLFPEGSGLSEYQINNVLRPGMNGDADLKIVLTHHPYICHDGNRDGTFVSSREEFIKACNDYDIDLVLSGHKHGGSSYYPMDEYGRYFNSLVVQDGEKTAFVKTDAACDVYNNWGGSIRKIDVCTNGDIIVNREIDFSTRIKPKPTNTPLLTFLQNHPNLFTLLRLLTNLPVFNKITTLK